LVKDQIALLTEQVEQASTDVAYFDIPIKDTIPIGVTVPVQKELTIPVSTTITLDGPVTLPVDTPLGRTDLAIPLQMDVPIRAQAPVRIDETFEVSTSVDLDLTLPIEVPVSQTVLADYLERLRLALINLSQQL
jgi:hypothetical protein